jgi:tRNA/rRNA methyltransferase/tRNA (cytidine32/uridine32-2'-O)-methyltransferase
MAESLLASVVVVLYEPQDPVNIAATIRAMKNMGVARMRLVRPVESRPFVWRSRPRDDGSHPGHPSITIRSTPRSRTAFASLDSRRVVARRLRLIDPKVAAAELLDAAVDGPVALVFGREDSGLPNDVLDRVHATVTIPTTNHASLNLARPR